MPIDKTKYERPQKLNLNLNFLKFICGIVIAGLLFYLGLSYVSQSGAQNFKVKKSVGKDLLVTTPDQTVGTINRAPKRKLAGQKFPRLDNNLTPATDYIDPFTQKKVFESIKHQVKPGESLWSIAKTYGRTVSTLASVNYDKLKGHQSLPVGIKLEIPNRNGVQTTVKKGQTLWDLANSYEVNVQTILGFNQLESAQHINKGEEIFIPGVKPLRPYNFRFDHGNDIRYIWPVKASKRKITSGFGPRQHPVLDRKIFHTGIDIAGGYGSTAFTSRPGRVKFVGQIQGYGKVVTVVHSSSCKTLYAHLNDQLVRRGQYLEQGQPIGKIGSSGLTTGPNLHFEIRINGKPVNPIKYLPNR